MKKNAPSRSLPDTAAAGTAGSFEPPLRRSALALLISACFSAHANPTLPQVVHGQATFNQQGNLFSIVNTPNTIINWQSFSIGQGELTRFIQQNANSSVLNRITGQDPSQILGALQSNGKVFLINPNGVLFGRDSRVDVNGLVASSLGLSNQDFLAGKMNFNAGDKAGAVINQGTITSGAGSQVLLIAPNVDNSGIISAPNGDVMLAAGHSVQLADASNPSLQVVLSAPGDQAINVGQVIAHGGKIGMVGALLNQRGVLNANSAVAGENGKIVLKASGKVLLEAGSLTTATNAAGIGGAITATGDQVGLLGNAKVDASGATGGGTVLLGGDYQGKNPAVSNARQVFVASDASINADALDSGDGGKVIVWGTETARVFGNISARGGAASGDGGLVETSGHYLDVNGIRVDTSSRRGKRGNWLLDPYDIDVVEGYGGELGSVGEFLGGMVTGSTSIGAATISNAESNVTLQATHRINFNSAINMVNSGVGLSAYAGESINVNAPITTSVGAVVLSANDATGGMAYGLGSNLNLNAAINTNGGNAYLSGASVAGAGTVNTLVGVGDLTLRANNASGGIALTGSTGGNQLIGNTLQLQADNITFGRGIRGNNVTLTPMSSGREITLGVVGAKPSDSLGLTNTELFQVVADTLTIGGSNAGTINQTGSLSISDYVTNLELRSGVGINLKSFFTVLHNLKLNVGGDGYGGDNLITSNSPLNVSGEFFLESGNWLQNSASLPSFSAYSFKIGRANFVRATGGDGSTASPYRIADVYGLQGVDKQVYNTNYILAGDIDAAGTASWNQGAGFKPLFGSDELAYSGVFDGASHAINNLTINGGNSSYYGSGLFARMQGGTIRNLTMQGGSVTGGNNVGAIVGNNSEGTLSNVTSSMAVSGTGNVGGLVGSNSGTISNASASGNVTGLGGGEGGMGGYVVGNDGDVSGSTIGGLVGANNSGASITLARASGAVTAPGAKIGGLVGNNDGAIDQAYATGGVGGAANIGGLVGRNGGSISNAYATGAIGASTNSDTTLSHENIGGLIGRSETGSSARYIYSSGSVASNGFSRAGAVVGRADPGAVVGFSYFNYQTSGVQMDAGGSSGRTTLQMQQQAQFGGFNFGEGAVWRIYEGNTTPMLKGFLKPLQVTASGAASRVYDGQLAAFTGTLAYSGLLDGDSAASGSAGYNAARNVGSYALGGLWSTKYDITLAGTTTLSIMPRALSVVLGGSKVYDGQLGFGNATLTLANTVAGDAPGVTGTAQFVDKNAGAAKAVNISGLALSGNELGNYTLPTTASGTAAISRASLSVSSVSAANKVYDGNNSATISANFEGLIGSDQVQLSGAPATFNDKNAGVGKAVAFSIGSTNLQGLDAGNYTLGNASGSATAEISRASLNLTGIGAASKVYDGSTGATVGATLNGAIGADQVQLSGLSGSFSDKNAATGKVVNYSAGNLLGLDAGNYTLANGSGSTTADITARALSLTLGGSKVYDGQTGFSNATLTLGNKVEGETLGVTGTAQFVDKNAGTAKAVNISGISLSGNELGNYSLANTASGTAEISRASLNLGYTGVNKTYDASTAAAVTITDNRIANDVLTATASAAFADKNAGASKAVTVQNAVLSGLDAGNYTLASHSGATTATISAKTLDLSFSGVNKVYDGSTAAAVTVADNRIVGDVLTATASAAFADKNAGAGKTVTVQNAALSGADAGNYTLASNNGATTATISAKTLDLAFTGVNKIYDGSTTATVSITDNRIANDVLTTTASAAFLEKNAGAGKAVTVQNAALSGADAGNYTLASNSGATTATISAKALDLSFSGVNKVYDGSTAAAVTITDNRIVGDVLTTTASAAFANKNAGAGKTVTVQNALLSGADAGNYTLASNSGATTANITARALDLSFSGVNKVYDGSTAATVSITDNRIANDVLTATASAAFADKNAGAGKAVTVQNAELSGADAGNYTLASNSGATTATISAKALDLTFVGVNKIYDGLTVAAVSITDNRIANDVLTATASAAFLDKNASAGKTVTVQNAVLSGADAGNYTLASNSGATTATIGAKTLDLSFSGVNKVYDGSTAATVSITDNRIANDVLTATASAAFANKNAGAGKAVTVQNAVLSGLDAGNYTLASNSGVTTATISAKTLDLSFSGVNKVYDGSMVAAVTVFDNRIVGDVLTTTASAAFANKNAGAGKAVTVQNAVLSGADAGNYTLASNSGATTATISAKTLDLAFAGVNKVYDGSTAATVSITDNRIANDVLTATASSAFANKNAGAGKAVTVQNAVLWGADAGNYTLASNSGATTATISAKTLDLAFAGVNKVYDGSMAATVSITDNRIANDVLTTTARAAFANKNAGAGKAVTVQNAVLSGADAGNYTLASNSGATTATISAKTLDLSFSGVNKVYDGSTAATVSITDNRIANDVLTATASAAFADKNAGAGKVVTVQNAVLSGSDAGNYTLVNVSGSTTAEITRASLNLTGISAASKVYDGAATATVDATLSGAIGTDKVQLSGLSGSFSDKNAAIGKVVNYNAGNLLGLDAGNYTLANGSGNTKADITPRALSLTLGGSKVYDGQTGFSNATLTLGNKVDGDTLGVTGTAQFVDKNAGTAKAVNISAISLSGNDLGNYSLADKASGTAEISRASLDLSYTGINKTYDGSTATAVSITDNRIAKDELTATASVAFDNKNAGAGKTVKVENAILSGQDAGNYTLASNKGETTATITPKTLDLSYTGINKTYDGSTATAVSITDNRIAKDELTATASAAFDNKNAGAGKTVKVENAILSGQDAGNYTLASSKGETTAAITPKTLDLSYTGINKTYDGSTAANVTITDNRIAGDVLSASASAAFGDKNAGAAKTVQVQNAALSGQDAGNYMLASTTGATTANIAQRALNLIFFGVNKVYDGSTAAALTISDDRIAGDGLTAAAGATFVNKNAGAAKAVTVQNASLSGVDAGNYTLVSNTGSTMADIGQRLLNVTFNGINKVYDGATAATVTAGLDDRIAGDILSIAGSAAFVDKNAGAAKAVLVNDVKLSGADAANYALASTTGAASAAIAQRALTLGYSAQSKTYDATTAATLAIQDDRIAGDVLSVSASAAFADKNVGNAKLVQVSNASLSGLDASNYALAATTGSALAEIRVRTIDAFFSGTGKVYDGTTAANYTLFDTRIAGDILALSASATYADKNAGVNKTINVRNIALSGPDAGNYALTSTSGTTLASITQRSLTLGFSGADKVYDGGANAAVAISDNRVAGDILTATANAQFADKNAAASKTITVGGAVLSGVDAGNYQLFNNSGATSATISQRALSLSYSAGSKVYDGATGAVVSVADDRIAGDILSASASGVYADKNVGSGKAIAVSNASLSGSDAANYRLVSTAGATSGAIVQRALSLRYSANGKVYDGGTGATVSIGDDRIAGDALNVAASAAFVDKNAGAAKAVTLGAASLSGVDAGNYRVVAPGTIATATITPAALVLASVSAANKTYDGTLAATVSGSVSGVLGGDAVSLSGGSGTFADRNYGSGKLVTVGGFGLAGADAGNYRLTSNSGLAQASIAQRALSTWIGASGGLWSDAANWDGGVIPVGANVLAADFGSNTGNVLYNAAAGTTVLKSLSSRGGLSVSGGSLTLGETLADSSSLGGASGLNLSGGALSVGGNLTTANYAQSGGVFGGLGNLTVSNSFSQSAGAIISGGNLAINQASGDLRFAALTARSISLSAGTGAISQSGAVIADSLATQSQNGTVLNGAGNQVKAFSASNSGAGGIALTNTTAPNQLLLGSLATGSGNIAIENTGGIESHAINANGGNVSLIAHSPVHVQGAISGNDISVEASTEVAFGDGARINAARNIAVKAGTDVTLDGAAALKAGNNIALTATNNLIMRGTSSLEVPATGSMTLVAQTGSISAATGVLIDSHGGPVSLTATKGTITAPSSIFVGATLASAIIGNAPAVAPTLASAATNYANSVNQQYSPLNTIAPQPGQSPLAPQLASNQTEKSDGKKDDVKKTYCN